MPILNRENHWRKERASRVSFLVDGAQYFEKVAESIEQAQEQLIIVGWDIHSQAPVGKHTEAHPGIDLADLLSNVAARSPDLQVHVLIWEPSPLFLAEREAFPLLRFGSKTGPNVHVHFADDHPIAASHHQKIVVVDDSVAFTGGLDLTVSRWDDRSHHPEDPRRRLPNGNPYGPFHDVQLAVEGAAAKALGDLARDRVLSATHQRLSAPSRSSDPWPQGLAADLEKVDVAIARTWQPHNPNEQGEVREVERLFVDSIHAAKDTIYIENQYLTSTTICEALSARIQDPEGPEIILTVPKDQSGPLEEATMGALRTDCLRKLLSGAESHRLRVVYPRVSPNVNVHVHAKVMVVDDYFVRVGSANLSNRSMGLDSECDAAIELEPGSEQCAAVLDFRDGLLGEHLGLSIEELRNTVQNTGSLVATIDELQGRDRTLRRLEVDSAPDAGVVEANREVVDPGRPLDRVLLGSVVPDDTMAQGRRRFSNLSLAVLGALFVAAVGSALIRWPSPESMARFIEGLNHGGAAYVVGTLGFVGASLVMVPVTILIPASVIVFGPWLGGTLSIVASVASASIAYAAGRHLMRETVQRWTGDRFETINRTLERNGIVAVAVVRLLPVAPFTVVNLAAGSSRVHFRDFVLGTFLGMAPGILALTVASFSIMEAVRHPGVVSWGGALVVVGIIAIALHVFRRFVGHDHSEDPPSGVSG
ncbi:MAG: VTT domain-containing protein [Myxococcales bacterium]|nr:VTT domain-containing protein [Myxococcales bacterium]